LHDKRLIVRFAGLEILRRKQDARAQKWSEHDFVAADPGRHTPNVTSEDDEHVVEELIAEGMDEALHEQMLQARRAQSAEEKTDEDEK
jgi:hypothetical protein